MNTNKKDSHKAVFGIYQSRTEVENGVDGLKSAGFSSQDISVLLPSNESTKEFAHRKATKAPEGVTTGAVSGAVIGGSLGWLAGIGMLAIPGVGPFVAAGPILASLAGAGVGGTAGGVVGALVGMGIPEYEAKRYEGVLKDGGILLSVHVEDAQLQKQAKDILQNTGATDIDSEGEVRDSKSPKLRRENRPLNR